MGESKPKAHRISRVINCVTRYLSALALMPGYYLAAYLGKLSSQTKVYLQFRQTQQSDFGKTAIVIATAV